MICPDCKSEMSKRWQARTAGDVTAASGLVWSCGVCGGHITMADMKSYGHTEHKIEVEHEPVSSLLTLPRPSSALTPWAPRDSKQDRE